MSRVTPRKRSDFPEFEPLFQGSAEMLGETPNSMLTMAHRPGILGTFGLLSATIFHKLSEPFSFARLRMTLAILKHARKSDPANEIDSGLQQLIAHASSLSAGCRYCQAHTAFSTNHLSVPAEKLDDILSYDTSPHYTPAERAAVALAFAAGRVPNAATNEHFVELRKYYNNAQIVEIVAVIALFGFLNRWNDTMATALEDPAKNFASAHLEKHGWEIGKHAP